MEGGWFQTPNARRLKLLVDLLRNTCTAPLQLLIRLMFNNTDPGPDTAGGSAGSGALSAQFGQRSSKLGSIQRRNIACPLSTVVEYFLTLQML